MRWEQILNNDDGQIWSNKCSLDILWLVLVLAETTEEEDVWVLGRRRAGCRWREVHRHRGSELKVCKTTDSRHPCMLQDVRQHAEMTKTERCGGKESPTPRDVTINSIMTRDPQTVMNVSISPQPNYRQESMLETRKGYTRAKETTICYQTHFHSKGQ